MKLRELGVLRPQRVTLRPGNICHGDVTKCDVSQQWCDRFPTVYQEARVALMTAARGEEGLGQLSKVALKVIDNIGSYGRITVEVQYSTGG